MFILKFVPKLPVQISCLNCLFKLYVQIVCLNGVSKLHVQMYVCIGIFECKIADFKHISRPTLYKTHKPTYTHTHTKTYKKHEKNRILQASLQAVAYLHSMGRIHRDIKSDNILINTKGAVKIADFGFCVQLTQETTTRHSMVSFLRVCTCVSSVLGIRIWKQCL
jgi:serine/threonine protein kinase